MDLQLCIFSLKSISMVSHCCSDVLFSTIWEILLLSIDQKFLSSNFRWIFHYFFRISSSCYDFQTKWLHSLVIHVYPGVGVKIRDISLTNSMRVPHPQRYVRKMSLVGIEMWKWQKFARLFMEHACVIRQFARKHTLMCIVLRIWMCNKTCTIV